MGDEDDSQTATADEPQAGGHGVESVAPTGRREAFRDLRRSLTDDELCTPGAVKLLLDALEEARARSEESLGYVERYHAADKRAAVLEEKATRSAALEIMFGVGLSVGSTLLGLAPSFWRYRYGTLLPIVGGVLVVGSIVGRLVKR